MSRESKGATLGLVHAVRFYCLAIGIVKKQKNWETNFYFGVHEYLKPHLPLTTTGDREI